jgi:hypothetical protein
MSIPNDPRTALVEALYNDPAIRPKIEDAIVEKFGDKARTAIPGRMEREFLAKEREEWRKEREADREERARERRERDLLVARKAVIEDPTLRVRPQEIPDIEKIMVERGVGTYADAAKLYRAEQTVAAPRGFSFTAEVPGLRGAGGDEFKGIIEDTDNWARNRAAEIINDFAAGRGDKWM